MLKKPSEMTAAERDDYRHALAAGVHSLVAEGMLFSVSVWEKNQDGPAIIVSSRMPVDREAAQRFADSLEAP